MTTSASFVIAQMETTQVSLNKGISKHIVDAIQWNGE